MLPALLSALVLSEASKDSCEHSFLQLGANPAKVPSVWGNSSKPMHGVWVVTMETGYGLASWVQTLARSCRGFATPGLIGILIGCAMLVVGIILLLSIPKEHVLSLPTGRRRKSAPAVSETASEVSHERELTGGTDAPPTVGRPSTTYQGMPLTPTGANTNRTLPGSARAGLSAMSTATTDRFLNIERSVLCQDLQVPEGTECILAMPSSIWPLRSEPRHVSILDKSGDELLNVMVRQKRDTLGGQGRQEHLLLSSGKDREEFATCTVTLPHDAGMASACCLICRLTGEPYARVEELPSTSSSPSTRNSRTYVVSPAAVANQRPWHITVTGDQNGKVSTVTEVDSTSQSRTIAVLGVGDFRFESSGVEYRELRASSLTDMSVLVLAFMGIDRMNAAEPLDAK